jgi:Zn-dependent metalloprotease
VHYTLITPGAVIEQGDLAVNGGKFQYAFNPVAVHAKVPLYDIASITTGKPQIGRVIHLTFFSEEKAAGGTFFDVTRVILRGTTAIAARPAVPSTMAAGGLPSVPQVSSAALAGALDRLPAGPVRISARSAGALRDWDGWIDALVRSGDLVAASSEADTVLAGRRHERLRQHYKGVPVVGADVTRQIKDGVTVSMFGTIHPGVELDTVPAVSADAASRVVARRTGAQVPAGHAPGLVILPMDDGRYALAWQAEARSATDVRACFVDAITGKVLLDYSNLKTQQAQAGRPSPRVEALDIRGDVARTIMAVGGSVAQATGVVGVAGAAAANVPADEAVMAARAGIEVTRQYFVQRFGRFALDGRDVPVPVLVHPVSLADWGRLGASHSVYFAGAFWDGRMVVLGEGTPPGAVVAGRKWGNASMSLDVVAHELTHGVLDASPDFIYRNESGALAEAFADIMGTAVEFASQPAGHGPSKADYLVGEDATSGGVRSLDNPEAHGSPDHDSRRATGTADNGGVHANSTIASHAYYLAVEGGTNRTSGLVVEGVGAANREQIEKVFFRAFVYLLPSSATFEAARAATIQSARDLYGEGSAAERAVIQAWTAVGVR